VTIRVWNSHLNTELVSCKSLVVVDDANFKTEIVKGNFNCRPNSVLSFIRASIYGPFDLNPQLTEINNVTGVTNEIRLTLPCSNKNAAYNHTASRHHYNMVDKNIQEQMLLHTYAQSHTLQV
jgi:hypothetical protein